MPTDVELDQLRAREAALQAARAAAANREGERDDWVRELRLRYPEYRNLPALLAGVLEVSRSRVHQIIGGHSGYGRRGRSAEPPAES